MPRILVVDDDPGILSVLETLLRGAGYEVAAARRGDIALGLVRMQHFDLILSDIHMDPMDGIELLTHIRKVRPDVPTIFLTAHGSIASALEAMRRGAFDYLTKPFKMDELLQCVRRALQYQQVLRETTQRRAQVGVQYRLQGIVAESAAMQKLCTRIERIAPADDTVLIISEKNNGSKLVAGTIHACSRRSKMSFVTINCAGQSGHPLEIELFGAVDTHPATGAVENKTGLIEAANGGTLFLEDIGSLPPDLQLRLLHVLRDHVFCKTGGTEFVEVDIRVIATSRSGLDELTSRGKFHKELARRLGTTTLEIPPLHKRTEDILPLARHFMNRELGTHAELFSIEPDAAIALERHTWPGNAGELECTIQHAVTHAKEGRIAKENLLAAATSRPAVAIPPAQHIEDFRARLLQGFLRSAVQSAQERAIADAAH